MPLKYACKDSAGPVQRCMSC